jgi:hypothetical protein
LEKHTADVTAILNLKLGRNDAGAPDVRAYLKALLEKLIQDEECFSGKRPFGNSGWLSDLYKPLVQAKLIDGSLDEDGYIGECDSEAAKKLIVEAIRSL